MATFNYNVYAPMLFDASDYTKLLKRKATALNAVAQAGPGTRKPQGPFYLSPGDVLSAAIGIQNCNTLESGRWCNLPAILPHVLSPPRPTPITPPSS